MASPSAIRPAAWPVNTGAPAGRADDSEIGLAFRLAGCGSVPATGLGVAELGLIWGKRLAALPAPMSKLDSPFRFGMGPSDNGGRLVEAGDNAPGLEDVPGEGVGEAVVEVVEVTATVSSAAGGVHFSVVTMLAVAVSFTELTDFAFDATAICA
jgi:hypothetical protein